MAWIVQLVRKSSSILIQLSNECPKWATHRYHTTFWVLTPSRRTTKDSGTYIILGLTIMHTQIHRETVVAGITLFSAAGVHCQFQSSLPKATQALGFRH